MFLFKQKTAYDMRSSDWSSDVCSSDLFTRIADSVAAEQLVPLLNDYAEALVSAVHDHGGQVLKFIGDGLLAIFDMEDPEEACALALDAAEDIGSAACRERGCQDE